jgi:hypothetical protein
MVGISGFRKVSTANSKASPTARYIEGLKKAKEISPVERESARVPISIVA